MKGMNINWERHIFGALWKLAVLLFNGLKKIAKNFYITLIWIVAVFVASKFGENLAYMVMWAGVGVIVTAWVGKVFGSRYPQIAPLERCVEFAPMIADVGREKRKVAARAETMNAYQFLAHANVMPVEKLMELNADARVVDNGDIAVMTVKSGIPGKTTPSIVSSARQFQSLYNAERVASKPLPHGGVEITFYRHDPLNEGYPTLKPLKVEPTKMRIECAVNAFGEKKAIVLGGAAGMTVGGEPGSGKSESITTALLSVITSEYVNTRIIDGKGGTEWTPYAGVAKDYVRGDEVVEPVYNVVKKQFDIMNDRLAKLEHTLGSSNFWNVSAENRLKAGVKLELLIIDECQGLFEARKSATKDEKAQLAEVERMCSALVKRGRSAGMFTIFMTQKPTSDSLPAAISSNCGLRVCFSVNTPQAEVSVLGVMPVDADTPSAARIPRSRPGGAVMATDTGQLDEVRFFYMDEDVKKQVLADAAKQMRLAA